MNNIMKRLVTVLVSLFLIAYVVYQAYLAFYHPIRTVRAQSSTVRDAISTSAFVMHDETLLQADVGTGVIDYTRADGERVPKGGVVANVYSTAQEAENANKLQLINKKIEQLQKAGTSDEAGSVDISVLDSETDNSMLSLADAACDSDLNSLEDASDELLALLNKKQLATGTVKNYSAEIAALQQQAAAIGSAGSAKKITSSISGCFISTVDGYEGMYDISKISDLRVSDIQKLLAAKPVAKAGAVGKIVSEYEWYITCVISNDDALNFKVGDQMSVRFLLSSQSEIPVTVAALNKSDGGCALVLECDNMTSKLAVMRKQSVDVIVREVTGIKLSNNDIHIVNGQKGVFVLKGNTVSFKTVKPLYSGNGYIVSQIDNTDSTRLQVYDSVIEDGDNLYDGKIVN